MSELREKIPESLTVTSARGVGYAFEHDVVVEQVKNERLERYFSHSPSVKAFLYTVVFVSGFSVIASSGYGISNSYYNANPPPYFKLENIDPQFTRDNTVNTPQLSPDGRFVAYKLSNSLLADSHLGLLDLKTRETQEIVPMAIDNGYKINLSGNKIVYQNTLTGKCEIRLVTFHDEDKTRLSDDRLSFCAPNSGLISFAWFNDNEFYANFVADGAPPTANNLPLHHLYRFDVDAREKYLVKRADYKGGIGFYSLEYDVATKLLYFIQTHNFQTTSIYQYDGKTIRKRHVFDQYLPFYTVSNNRLIYKHNNKSFVISDLNKGFNKPQELLRPRLVSINKPHLQGNKLVYMEGNVYRKSFYQLISGKSNELGTNGFVPLVLANYKNQLVFTAQATNITQVYLLNNKNKAIQISKMVVNENIHHLEIAGDIFVLSYADKVVIYQLENQQLALVKTISNFNRGVIDKSGKYLLLSHSNGNEANNIVEKHLSDLTPTGKKLSEVKFAFYHHSDIIYLDENNELFRLTAKGPKTIANDITADMFEHISINGDFLYYFEWFDPKRPVFKLNLVTGKKDSVNLNGLMPTKIQSANNSLFFVTNGGGQATIVVGDVVLHK